MDSGRKLFRIVVADIVSVSACADLTLPPGAGLRIDTIHGPRFLVCISICNCSFVLSKWITDVFLYLQMDYFLCFPCKMDNYNSMPIMSSAIIIKFVTKNWVYSFECITNVLLCLWQVADNWETIDSWLDAIRLVYTIFARGRSDVLAGIITGWWLAASEKLPTSIGQETVGVCPGIR